MAANRFWVASGTGNWDDTANWSSTSGGAGGASVPNGGDNAIFNGQGLGHCLLNSSVAVGSLKLDGYTGTIDQMGYSFQTSGATILNSGTISNSLSVGEFTVNTSSIARFAGTTFDVPVEVTCATLKLNGSTFHSKASFEHTGGQTWSNGGNVFNDSVVIENNGLSWLFLAETKPDTFNAQVVFKATAQRLFVAHTASGNYFNGDIVLESGNSEGWIYFGHNGGSSVLEDGKAISEGLMGLNSGELSLKNFVQLGSYTQKLTSNATVSIDSGSVFHGRLHITADLIELNNGIYHGPAFFEKTGGYCSSQGGNVFNDSVTMENSGDSWLLLAISSPDTFNDVSVFRAKSQRVYVANGSRNNLFGGDIVLESGANAGRIFLGSDSGSSILADGMQILEGPMGYMGGLLEFQNFTQLGSTPQVINFGESLKIGPQCTWNGSVRTSSEQINVVQSVFNDDASFTKTGSGDDHWVGNNTFKGHVSFTHQGSDGFAPAYDVANTYLGDVTYVQESGSLMPAVVETTFYKGHLYVSSVLDVVFGSRGGRVVINGSSEQFIDNLGSSGQPTFTHLRLDKLSGDVTLYAPITVTDSLALASGIIHTSALDMLTLETGCDIDGASNNSFVSGPVRKNGSAAFTFPIGKNGSYHPLVMNKPTGGATSFTAEYFALGAGALYDSTALGAGVSSICRSEYWTLQQGSGSSDVNVSIPFENSGWAHDADNLVMAAWNGEQWNNHGRVVQNETDSFITSSIPISSFEPYAVITTATAGSEQPNSIESMDANLGSITAFPNPSRGWVTFSGSFNHIPQIAIMNTAGVDVSSQVEASLTGQNVQINMASLPVGVYTARVGSKVTRLVKF